MRSQSRKTDADCDAPLTQGYPEKPEKSLNSPACSLRLKKIIEANPANAAWFLHIEDDAGKIEAGKSADTTVLNHNLFEIPAADIHKMAVEKTISQSKTVLPGSIATSRFKRKITA